MTTSTRNSMIASIKTATITKKATTIPKTTAREAFCAGTTVLSRMVLIVFSSASTASVVQSATCAPSLVGCQRLPRPLASQAQSSGRTLQGCTTTASSELVPSASVVCTTI